MAFTTTKSHALLGNLGLMSRSSNFANGTLTSQKFLKSQNISSPRCQRRNGRDLIQHVCPSRNFHGTSNNDDINRTDDNLFRIGVIEIDNNGNSEVKNMRLETLVNELRATEKLKLDKILNERTENDLYNWSRTGIMERKSILSKEYQKQKRSQIPLRDLRMFFRHINLG